MQLLGGVVEQLLVDTKRARDTEAAAMNMQLVTWRDRAAAKPRSWRAPATPCARGGSPDRPENAQCRPAVAQSDPDDPAGDHRAC